MKIRALIASAIVVAGLGFAASAQAFPVATGVGAGQSSMVQVADWGRCPPDMHPGPYGDRCFPNHFRPRPRLCPPGWQMGPRGDRCWPERRHPRPRLCPPGMHIGPHGDRCWPDRRRWPDRRLPDQRW